MQNEITAPQPLFNSRGTLANPGWARRMYFDYRRENMAAPLSRLREWDYYFIGSETMGASITISFWGGFSMLTAKLLHFQEGYFRAATRTIPEDICSPRDDQGTAYFRCDTAEAMFIRKPGLHVIKLDMQDYWEGQPYRMDIRLTVPETERMVIATPFAEGEECFFFNEKLNCMRAGGTLRLGALEHTFRPGRDFAVLDFGRGVWPERNRWYWSSASGELDGHSFGFNLGYGFGDLSHATENMIFYDGVAHKLDQIRFDIPAGGHMAAPWHIGSGDGRFEMEFKPVFDRYSPCDLAKGGSLQHQVFGHFTGRCALDGGETLEVKDFFGFAEDVQNNWIPRK